MAECEKITKEYFEDFLAFLPVAVCFVDSEGYILKVNKKMEKLLGYKSHELIDDRLNKLFGDNAKEILNKELKDEEIVAQGKNKEVSVNIFSEKRVGKEKTCIFIALFDLSRAKEIEKKMEEKVKELERFNRLATGRELRMVELKRDKKKLREEKQELKEEVEKLEEQIQKIKTQKKEDDEEK
ncbi:MAG: PAS domain S-box protein [Patescibacteria group bacterium]